MCAEWAYSDAWHIKDVCAAKVDGQTIKENTWYTLENGEFVEEEEEQ